MSVPGRQHVPQLRGDNYFPHAARAELPTMPTSPPPPRPPRRFPKAWVPRRNNRRDGLYIADYSVRLGSGMGERGGLGEERRSGAGGAVLTEAHPARQAHAAAVPQACRVAVFPNSM